MAQTPRPSRMLISRSQVGQLTERRLSSLVGSPGRSKWPLTHLEAGLLTLAVTPHDGHMNQPLPILPSPRCSAGSSGEPVYGASAQVLHARTRADTAASGSTRKNSRSPRNLHAASSWCTARSAASQLSTCSSKKTSKAAGTPVAAESSATRSSESRLVRPILTRPGIAGGSVPGLVEIRVVPPY